MGKPISKHLRGSGDIHDPVILMYGKGKSKDTITVTTATRSWGMEETSTPLAGVLRAGHLVDAEHESLAPIQRKTTVERKP